MARYVPDDCILCQMNSCNLHSKVKPSARRVTPPKKVINVPLPARAEAPPSKAVEARKAASIVDEQAQIDFENAIRCLAPIISDADLDTHVLIIGQERVNLLKRLRAWKLGR